MKSISQILFLVLIALGCAVALGFGAGLLSAAAAIGWRLAESILGK